MTLTVTPVRVVLGEDGKPLFVAKDVAEALGHAWDGMGTIEHVPGIRKGVGTIPTPEGITWAARRYGHDDAQPEPTALVVAPEQGSLL